jgi:long-chain acyl-CoA synthetase
MAIYDERPWRARYDAARPDGGADGPGDAVSVFRATVARVPDADAIRYFDGRIGFRELDGLTDAFAAGLRAAGIGPGDRVALFLQNVPQFVVALVGTWKLGGIAVAVSPMNREKEVALLLRDSGAAALVCLEGLYRDVAAHVVGGTGVRLVVTTSELEFQTRDDPRVLGGVERVRAAGTTDLADLLARFRGRVPPPVRLRPDDVAVLTYTSGTTGPPKGAMNTHGNVVFNARTYRDWARLDGGDVVLGVAPLFHVTGLIAHVAVGLLVGTPLVLTHRFEPDVVVHAIREHRPTFTVGSITVFIALMNAPTFSADAVASLVKVWSGGAPIPPSTVRAYREATGTYIHNIYGLTETTSPSHATPYGLDAPVDPGSGALSVGVPVYDTVSRIVDDERRDVPVGEVGEIVVSGPQVVPGYWNRPEESERALPGGALHTGDVGFMDAEGWFYVVDRKKDQINVSGFKVWPREVEDVLYEHEAVREAAVVGAPDPYRGETVVAFVSLREGRTAEPAELVAFCRRRMAAHKYPRQVRIVAEVPKTPSGKVLRRELRVRARTAE